MARRSFQGSSASPTGPDRRPRIPSTRSRERLLVGRGSGMTTLEAIPAGLVEALTSSSHAVPEDQLLSNYYEANGSSSPRTATARGPSRTLTRAISRATCRPPRRQGRPPRASQAAAGLNAFAVRQVTSFGRPRRSPPRDDHGLRWKMTSTRAAGPATARGTHRLPRVRRPARQDTSSRSRAASREFASVTPIANGNFVIVGTGRDSGRMRSSHAIITPACISGGMSGPSRPASPRLARREQRHQLSMPGPSP